MADIKLGYGIGIKATLLTPAGAVCDLRDALYVNAVLTLPNGSTMYAQDIAVDRVTNAIYVRLLADRELTAEGNYSILFNVKLADGVMYSTVAVNFANVTTDANAEYKEFSLSFSLEVTDYPQNVERTGASPKVSSRQTWLVYNDEAKAYEDTGIPAEVNFGDYYTKEETDEKVAELESEVSNKTTLKGVGWLPFTPYDIFPDYQYRLTYKGGGSAIAFEARYAVVKGFETLTDGQSCVVSTNKNATEIRTYLNGGGELLVENISLYSVLEIDKSLKNIEKIVPNLDDDVAHITKRKTISGSGWTDYINYDLYKGVPYKLKNVGEGLITSIELNDSISAQGFKEIASGESVTIIPDGNATSFRVYFGTASILEIANATDIPSTLQEHSEDIDLLSDEIESIKREKNQKNIISGAGWLPFTPYDMFPNYQYKLTYRGEGSAIAFEAKGATLSGFETLADGQSCIVTVNIEASEIRAYLNGGGELLVENISSPSLLELDRKIEVVAEMSDGFAEKDSTKVIIVVNQNGKGDYSTIAEAYASITDSSFVKQYEIVVYPGEYRELNLIPPPFTHTHGLAPNSVVVTSEGVDDTSTLPVFDQQGSSSKLSNMTIISHNGYCIHYDVQLHKQVILNENLHLIKNKFFNNGSIIGGGTFSEGTKYVWKNCIFEAIGFYGDVSCHTNGNQLNGNTHLIFDACQFINCNPRVGNVGGFGHYVCELNNCAFGFGDKGIANWYSSLRNIDDSALYRANANEWQIIGGNNKNLAVGTRNKIKTIKLSADYPIVISGSAADLIFGANPKVSNSKSTRTKCTILSELYIDDGQAGDERYGELVDVYQLWKRLGDCSADNKTLTIEVNGITKSYTFNKNYLNTKDSETDIITAMQDVLTNVDIEKYADDSFGYDFINTTEKAYIEVADEDVLKGEFITKNGNKATDATPPNTIVGMALNDAVQGERVQVWTSAIDLEDTIYTGSGDIGLNADGELYWSGKDKPIGFVKNRIFYPYY